MSLHPQRFEFVFTPKHGSWLNMIESLFSKMARSMLRGIRVASRQELIDRIHLYFEHLNADPVIFRSFNPATLATAPSGAKLPCRMTMWPDGCMGASKGLTTDWRR